MVTISTIFVYDTQHPHPLARISGCHLATINDATWSPDGNMLVVCSSDGYLSFVRFPAGSLGEPLPITEVPEVVKRSLPCLYDYFPAQSSQEPTFTDKLSSDPLSVVLEPGFTSAMEIDPCWDQFITPPKAFERRDDDLFNEDEIEIVSSIQVPRTAESAKSFNCNLSSSDSQCSALSSVIGLKLLPSSIDSVCKKRRIVPISVQSAGDCGEGNIFKINSSPVCESKGESSNEVNAVSSISTNLELKKEKKRIVPMLMTPYSSSSSMSSQPATSSYPQSGASSSIQNMSIE